MNVFLESIKQKILSNPKRTLPIFIVVATFIVLFVIFNREPVVKKNRTGANFLPIVDLITVKKETVRIPIKTRGQIEPKNKLNIISIVNGEVIEISPHFQTGATFNKGDVLLRVDPLLMQVDVNRAKVAYQESLIKEQQLKASVEAQSSIMEKNPDLSDLAQGKPQLEAANIATKGYELALRVAEKQLAMTTLHAPFNGRVFANTVQDVQALAVGTPIGIIYATDAYNIRLPIKQEQLAFIGFPNENAKDNRIKTPNAEVSTTSVSFAMTKQKWQGKVLRSEGVISKIGTTYIVTEFYQNKDQRNDEIIIGTLVDVEIAGKPLPNIITIPTKALHEDNTVWVMNSEHKVEIRKVDFIHRGVDAIYISSGLDNGDQLIVNQLNSVVANMMVKPRELKQESSNKDEVKQ